MMAQETEQVVLLDDNLKPSGVADKAAIHTGETPLHLAFSCHISDADGRVLVTRRALNKLTWPGVWTNSACGHPAPGEEMTDAVRRRVRYELGLELEDLQLMLPDFRYRAVDASGIVENEFCPVYTALAVGEPAPRDDEVSEYRWVLPSDLQTAATAAPWAFSPWIVLQLQALEQLG